MAEARSPGAVAANLAEVDNSMPPPIESGEKGPGNFGMVQPLALDNDRVEGGRKEDGFAHCFPCHQCVERAWKGWLRCRAVGNVVPCKAEL